MTNHKKRFFSLLALLLPLLWLATGCTKQETSECQSSIPFTIKAYDADHVTELNNSTVSDVELYVFDQGNLFVQKITTTIGSTVEISIPDDDKFTVVALGNSGGGNQTLPAYNVGDHISVGLVALKATTRANPTYTSPDDLFLGSLTVLKENLTSGSNLIIPLYRKTGSMNVAIRGLKQYFGFNDDNYSVVINSSNRGFSLDGTYKSGAVSYTPTGGFNAAGEYIVPSLNMLAGTNVTIDIYHGTQLMTTISNSITVTEGLTTQVRLSYLGTINITVDIINWGTETVWKDFN